MKIQNKIILSVATFLVASTSAQAESTYYMSYSQTFQHAKDKTILGVQPFDELFSVTNPRHGIEVGKKYQTNLDLDFLIGADFGYIPQEDQYDTLLSIKFQKREPYYSLKPFFASKVGIGMQNNKGETVELSTSATISDFIVGNEVNNPSKGTFQEDTLFFGIGFELGTAINLYKNLDLITSYEFQHKSVQISYTVEGKETVNSLTVPYNFNNVKVGLSYSF